MNQIVNLPMVTMNHFEIAELTNKRPDNVKRTIESLVDAGIISHPQIEDGIKSTNGAIPKVYVFSGEQGILPKGMQVLAKYFGKVGSL